MNSEPEIEHGGHYELAALIAQLPLLRRVELAYPMAVVVPLAQGLALIPLRQGLTAALAAGSGPVPAETGFARLTPGLQALLTSTSCVGPIGMFEAVHLGNEGWQTAAVWRDGGLAYGPAILHGIVPIPNPGAGPFGSALRALGARSEGQADEFVAVGLGRNRRTDDWI